MKKQKVENEKVESTNEENEKVESKKDGDENENQDDDYDYENEDDDETMDQNKIIKNLNDNLDEIIDKSKSFEKQIKLLKKRKDLKGYNDYGDEGLRSKFFKLELADMSNEIDEKLF